MGCSQLHLLYFLLQEEEFLEKILLLEATQDRVRQVLIRTEMGQPR
jgi:Mg-chelatase subunit ChlI